MSIRRFSSLRAPLDHAFLRDQLQAARSYKRIASYFRSSIFELVGKEIAAIPLVRIVCNSELDAGVQPSCGRNSYSLTACQSLCRP